MERIKRWLTNCDGFQKMDTVYLKKTCSGGYITILTYSLMILLALTELSRYLNPPIRQRYIVDPEVGTEVQFAMDMSVATECDKLVVLLGESNGRTRIIGPETVDFIDEEFAPLLE